MKRKAMSLNEVMEIIYSTPIKDGRAKQVSLLCIKELWVRKHGFRDVYTSFVETFGLKALRHLVALTLVQVGVPVRDRGTLGEDEACKVLSLARYGAVMLTLQHKGKLAAIMNDEGKLAWCLIEYVKSDGMIETES